MSLLLQLKVALCEPTVIYTNTPVQWFQPQYEYITNITIGHTNVVRVFELPSFTGPVLVTNILPRWVFRTNIEQRPIVYKTDTWHQMWYTNTILDAILVQPVDLGDGR